MKISNDIITNESEFTEDSQVTLAYQAMRQLRAFAGTQIDAAFSDEESHDGKPVEIYDFDDGSTLSIQFQGDSLIERYTVIKMTASAAYEDDGDENEDGDRYPENMAGDMLRDINSGNYHFTNDDYSESFKGSDVIHHGYNVANYAHQITHRFNDESSVTFHIGANGADLEDISFHPA